MACQRTGGINMPVPAEISKPAFRVIWQTAKNSAVKKAKGLKNESSYNTNLH